MVKYNVRARQLLDVVNEVKSNRIILSPYFQRNFVWREVHKVDFIKTIMLGLPFPEIFIAKGDLDVDAMVTTSCIVDGQQRLSSIIGFIDGDYRVDGKSWSDLSVTEKELFLKYEIAVIELDIKHDDPLIQDVFKRLNRTYYSLSNIEKLSSEFAPAEIMLIAKLLIRELEVDTEEEGNTLEYHPNFPKEFLTWARSQQVSEINDLLVSSPIFSAYEISRQVHLMFTLNILGTILVGFYNRNITKDVLNNYSDKVPNKEYMVQRLNEIAGKIRGLTLDEKSYWYNKANAFSLILAMYNTPSGLTLNNELLKERLLKFESNIPEEYRVAAKEGVNNKGERLLRNEYIVKLLTEE